MIKVSIVVPVYNVERYLEKCLYTLVKQTLKDIEIIIVNDGSTDRSQEIINKFKQSYGDIIKIVIKKNGGLSDARNVGISHCKGEYIGFVDSDDYIDLSMYEKMYNEAIKNNCDVVSCDYSYVYLDNKNKKKRVNGKIGNNKEEQFLNMKAAAWNKIYKRSLIESTRILFPKGLIYEDTSFFCKLLPHINKTGYVEESLVYYVQRNGSIANTQGEKTGQIFDICKDIVEYYKNENLYGEYYSELEFIISKILLGSSIIRISKIKDKKLRYEMSVNTVLKLNELFPKWKKNKYIKTSNFIRRLYMYSINKISIKIYIKIFNIDCR